MKEIKEKLVYLKSFKRFFYLNFLVFIISFLIGFFFPVMEKEFLEIIKEFLEIFEGKNFFETFLLLFFNNSRISLLAIFLGIFLGFIPMLILFFNGYLAGFVFRFVSKEKSFFEIWKFFPHGVFELPAFFISCALGLNLGIILIKEFSFKKTIEELEKALKVFVLIIIPLLLIAALIETILIFLI